MLSKKASGDFGENLAAKYLSGLGFKILERNFRIRGGEIDIIAVDQRTSPPTLVFVEVKTRSGNKFGTPLESINYFKLKALRKSLMFYKSSHPKLPDLLRIDAVTVMPGPDKFNIQHHENIDF